MTVRIYAPDGEPFDVPEYKVADLVLLKNFSQKPQDPNGVALVQEVPGYREAIARAQAEWDAMQIEQDYAAGHEVVVYDDDAEEPDTTPAPEPESTSRRSRRKAA